MIKLKPGIPDDKLMILSMRKDFYSIDQYPFDTEEQDRLTTEFFLNPSLWILYKILKEDRVIGYFCLTFGYSFEYGELAQGERNRNKC